MKLTNPISTLWSLTTRASPCRKSMGPRGPSKWRMALSTLVTCSTQCHWYRLDTMSRWPRWEWSQDRDGPSGDTQWLHLRWQFLQGVVHVVSVHQCNIVARGCPMVSGWWGLRTAPATRVSLCRAGSTATGSSAPSTAWSTRGSSGCGHCRLARDLWSKMSRIQLAIVKSFRVSLCEQPPKNFFFFGPQKGLDKCVWSLPASAGRLAIVWETSLAALAG